MASDSVIKVSGLSSRKVDLGLLGSSVVSSKLQIRATVGALGFSVTENKAIITKKELIGTKLFERGKKKTKQKKTGTGGTCCPETFRRKL